jgi:predicted nuclease of restriction endonuclease-like (RecB) superfamily
MTRQPAKRPPRLFDRVAAILEEARATVVRTVNTRMVIAYWLIGREIVQEEQGGKPRAGYGDALLEDLSRRLTERYGKGYSVSSLKDFRQFHLCFADRLPPIRHEPRGELVSQNEIGRGPRYQSPSKTGTPRPAIEGVFHEARVVLNAIHHAPPGELPAMQGFSADLSWTHYRLLMRIGNMHARSFYEIEAIRGRWSTPDLERQINTLLFERLLKSRNKKGVMALAREGNQSRDPVDILKDPFVLEFLDLPEGHELVENRMEEALVGHMRQFLLELGCGFAFVARQQRLTLDGDHFYVDLTFYHTRLKCYVLIDLKVGRLTQQDLGQMQLYVNYYDRELCAPDDNPTVGLILCTDRNEAMVRYTLPQGQKQIFAARYRTALPSEEDLLRLLRRDWDIVVREQQSVYGDTKGNP